MFLFLWLLSFVLALGALPINLKNRAWLALAAFALGLASIIAILVTFQEPPRGSLFPDPVEVSAPSLLLGTAAFAFSFLRGALLRQYQAAGQPYPIGPLVAVVIAVLILFHPLLLFTGGMLVALFTVLVLFALLKFFVLGELRRRRRRRR